MPAVDSPDQIVRVLGRLVLRQSKTSATLCSVELTQDTESGDSKMITQEMFQRAVAEEEALHASQ